MFARRTQEEAARIPPGQHLTRGWPVLHEGPIPAFDPDAWRFRCFGLVGKEIEWTWAEFTALPRVTLTADFHCVTGWSKLDNSWEGVAFRTVAALCDPAPTARAVLMHAPHGYTANLPLEALMDDDVLFAINHNGEPLVPKHGGPMRLIVPKRYAWKSVKWVNALEFLPEDERGFWEVRGYHNDAHPFAEERYSWQE